MVDAFIGFKRFMLPNLSIDCDHYVLYSYQPKQNSSPFPFFVYRRHLISQRMRIVAPIFFSPGVNKGADDIIFLALFFAAAFKVFFIPPDDPSLTNVLLKKSTQVQLV